MIRTRILIPIFALLFALGIVYLAASLPWIPEWYGFQTGSGFIGVLGALYASVLLVRGIWRQTQSAMKVEFRILLAIASGILMAVLVYLGTMLTVLSADGGFMGPEFVQKVEFPDYDTTIYIYDADFLDSKALLRMRRNWLPFAYDIAAFDEWNPQDLELGQQGEWAVCDVLKVYLPTGEVVLK